MCDACRATGDRRRLCDGRYTARYRAFVRTGWARCCPQLTDVGPPPPPPHHLYPAPGLLRTPTPPTPTLPTLPPHTPPTHTTHLHTRTPLISCIALTFLYLFCLGRYPDVTLDCNSRFVLEPPVPDYHSVATWACASMPLLHRLRPITCTPVAFHFGVFVATIKRSQYVPIGLFRFDVIFILGHLVHPFATRTRSPHSRADGGGDRQPRTPRHLEPNCIPTLPLSRAVACSPTLAATGGTVRYLFPNLDLPVWREDDHAVATLPSCIHTCSRCPDAATSTYRLTCYLPLALHASSHSLSV